MARPSVPGAGGHPDAPAGDTILAVHDDGAGHYDSLDSAAPRDATGREVRYRGWKTMPFVIGNETFEKLGSIGTAANLMVYLTSVFHMTNVRAAIALNAFSGTTNLATVFGAFASDLYLGRYATVCMGCIATLIGMIILTLTAGVPALHPPPCSSADDGQCAGATRSQFAVLVLSFLFIVAGAGGIRPCSLPFGADQFNPHTESGRRGINSFFNWYYFTLTIAVCGSSTGIIYVQSNVSWWIGFAIPAALMFVSCALFFAGAGLYVRVRPEGIPLAGVLRVTVAAFRKRRAPAPEDPAASLFRIRHASALVVRLPYTDQFRFLDKAAVVESKSEVDESSGCAKDPWRLCSVQQVEEAKCVLRILPVWCTCIVYYVSFAQTNTYVILQAAQSDRHVGGARGFEVPPASFTIFPMLALTVWIPFYDRLMLPWLRRLTAREEGITLLQRMGVGMVLSVVAMLIAGMAEQRRRELAELHTATNGGSLSANRVSPMSAFWLVPQLAALGLSEAFNQVSQMEFYYKQFPENMRSVAGSLLFSGLALSSYLSGLLVIVVHRATVDPDHGDDGWLAEDLNRGKLDSFYFLIAFVGAVNFFVFLACAKWYRYKGMDDDEQDANRIDEWQPRSVVGDDCPEDGRVPAN
ncbi:Protein NRT1/ PTR FAMILY 2.11 [Dichanthelium oligosanthes]|uniref:Protein NRT1/ PTR FAMILY 2.11 n=1 Tax=Dichanthelium oligosanthes TaxID=888268 RepID=A0A1E5WCI3_9POAL|nr:Protein NRT1/ PTR FAMILY 2.11 [Dichanthelium oligosanthes]